MKMHLTFLFLIIISLFTFTFQSSALEKKKCKRAHSSCISSCLRITNEQKGRQCINGCYNKFEDCYFANGR